MPRNAHPSAAETPGDQATSPPEFDRLAVVTIQGGGIYGLNLLGQLSYLTEELNIVPVAVAGNSAGSIVATLYWAGYAPWEIRNIFARLANQGKLTDLIGPYEPADSPFDLAAFQALKDGCVGLLDVNLESQPSRNWFGRRWQDISGLARVPGMLISANELKKKILPHVATRGVFRGDNFIEVIDTLIRDGPLLKGREGVPTGQPLEFGDVRKLIANDSTFNPPALFLTATNVTGRKLEVFNSIDERYDRVPIAKAVRASAGFPVFFRPVEFKDERYAGWYSDGGIVSNYPAWIFSKEFRIRLLETQEYRPLAGRPWIHFGLRLEHAPIGSNALDASPKFFVSSLARLVLGGEARGELEGRLEKLVTRSFTIQQPPEETGVPPEMDLLDVNQVTPDLVNEMYRLGRVAGRRLGRLHYQLPERLAVEAVLKQLVDRVPLVFRQPDHQTIQFRSNVFIPIKNRLINRYSVNMAPPPPGSDRNDPTSNNDHDLQLRFDAGLTGFCLALRRPLICNLEKIGQQDPSLLDKLFGMSLDQHNRVRKDRTWLASVPIFDPFATYPRDIATLPSDQPPPHLAAFHHTLAGRVDGAILGVLNLDANLPYTSLSPALDSDPNNPNHYQDLRIVATLNMMTATASEIGELLSHHLGRDPIPGNRS